MQWRVLLLFASGCSFSTAIDNPAIDADPTPSDGSPMEPQDGPQSTKFALRIDVGNTAGDFIDGNGTTWVRDTYCTGEFPNAPGAVRGTTDDALYQTARYESNASFACTITGVPNAMLRVTIYGAELWVGGSQDCNFGSQRTMDVTLEATRVANDLNVWTASGGCVLDGGGNTGAPFTRSYDINVTDGTLDITLAPGNSGQRDPVLQAVEIVEL